MRNKKLNVKPLLLIQFSLCLLIGGSSCKTGKVQNTVSRNFITVPFILDHNRMLVAGEIQRADRTWRKVRFWVDSGNPTFYIGEPLARDLGIDLSAMHDTAFKGSGLNVKAPGSIRIGGMTMNIDSLPSRVVLQPFWLFSTMHNDANLPSTLLKNYQVVFDYQRNELTLAQPGSIKPVGIPSQASIQAKTGIVQIDAFLEGDSLSFALDNGASYSFMSIDLLLKYSGRHPDWPAMQGTAGYANMWGWFPAGEESFPVISISGLKWGANDLPPAGMVGVPRFSPDGPSLGEWYSRKTAKPVAGFLGANVLKNYRVEIDYANSQAYFLKAEAPETDEMDLVGISIRPLPDSTFQVVGIVQVEGQPAVSGVEPGDILIGVDGIDLRGATMGRVVDALRGKAGESRVLEIVRNGQKIIVEAKVMHLLGKPNPLVSMVSRMATLPAPI